MQRLGEISRKDAPALQRQQPELFCTGVTPEEEHRWKPRGRERCLTGFSYLYEKHRGIRRVVTAISGHNLNRDKLGCFHNLKSSLQMNLNIYAQVSRQQPQPVYLFHSTVWRSVPLEATLCLTKLQSSPTALPGGCSGL